MAELNDMIRTHRRLDMIYEYFLGLGRETHDGALSCHWVKRPVGKRIFGWRCTLLTPHTASPVGVDSTELLRVKVKRRSQANRRSSSMNLCRREL